MVFANKKTRRIILPVNSKYPASITKKVISNKQWVAYIRKNATAFTNRERNSGHV